MITKNKYAVQFYDDSIRIFEAENIESLCFTIAEYYGFCDTLYGICMRGCKTCEENILVTNEFAENHYDDDGKIEKIYLISSILWGE